MRGVVKFLLTLVLGVALIWLGFWWYAESRLQSGFTNWANNQTAQGWKISYDSIQRGTSMLDAAVTINNLNLVLPPGPEGGNATIALPAVTLRIHALNPLVFHTDLPNKIAVTLGNNLALVLNTGSIALSENLDPDKLFNRAVDPFRGGDFSAGDIDILASAGSLLVLHIDSLTSHADLDFSAGPANTAISSRITFDNIVLSPLITRLAAIPFDGKLSHLVLFARISGPLPPNLPAVLDQLSAESADLTAQQKQIVPLIHQWAAQGGTGNAGLNLNLGPSTVAAAGSLKFDANLQPTGTGDLTADHLDQFTAALTNSYPMLQDDIARAEAQLSPYLSNTDQGGQILNLHLTYGKPGILINGQKVADMKPLDWNALENPLPPPTQAQGDGSGAASPGPASP
jgi:hypothetical protein